MTQACYIEPQFRHDFTYLRVQLYKASNHETIIELIFNLDNIIHRNKRANELRWSFYFDEHVLSVDFLMITF